MVQELLDPERWKEAVRQQWTEAAPGWRKTHAQAAVQSRAATEAILEAARVRPGMHVLDMASGTGTPAHDIASVVGPNGRVVATDLVPDMLAAAEEIAQQQGLTNMAFHHTDAEALPFPDESFDAVTCRFGVMFLPNVARALTEVLRVLKPAGRVALVAWGPAEENGHFMAVLEVLRKYGQMPSRAPDDPRPPDLRFRFAQPGGLSASLRGGGFQEVMEETRRIPWPFLGSPQEALQRTLEGPNRRIFESIPADNQEQVKAEALEIIGRYYDGRQVNFPATIVVASGVR